MCFIIIITSSDDIQPSTLLSNQSPSGLILKRVLKPQALGNTFYHSRRLCCGRCGHGRTTFGPGTVSNLATELTRVFALLNLQLVNWRKKYFCAHAFTKYTHCYAVLANNGVEH